MRNKPKFIAALGYYGGGNLGNEALLDAMLRCIRACFPDASISGICGFPEGVTQKHFIPAVSIFPSIASSFSVKNSSIGRLFYRFFIRLPAEIPNWITTYFHLRKIDLVVIPGTGIFSDYRTGPFDVPLCLFRWCLTAKILKIPVFFVNVTAGPIRHPVSRLLLTMAARIASYRSYRDKVSRDYMKRIGVNVVGDPVYPDLVFSLPLPTHATSKFYVNPAEHPKAVGLGVMTYYGWHLNQMISETIYQNYINKITKFVQWLLEHKYNVHVLIGEDSDDKAANDLLKKFQSNPGMNSEYSISYKPARTIYDVFQQISETDIVVASRFHNIVCALMLNRPVLSLGYADKNGALMAEMDLAKFDQHIENFDVDVLIQHFSEVAKDCASFIRRISEKNQEYRKILSNQFEELCATWKVRRPHR